MTILIRALNCALLCSVLLIKNVGAQCPNSQPYQTISYDTTAIGNGNNIYSIPQFDPSIGTLYSVQVDSKIYFNYSYTLTNTSGSTQSYKVTVDREDLLQATSPNNPTPIDLIDDNSTSLFKYTPALGTGVPIGASDTLQHIYNPKNLTTTFANNVVPFLGVDTLHLTYTTITNDGVVGNAQVSISNKQVYDSIVFKVTYNYCPAVSLPSKLISLNYTAESGKVILNWSSLENLTDGSYEILKSLDGRTYTSINKQTINAQHLNGYSFLYKQTIQDGNKAFFQVKQIDQNGNVTYSKVISAILPPTNNIGQVTTEKKMLVYPTVPNGFINVFIPSGNNKDEWDIKIISLAGKIMQQSKFSNTNLAKVTLMNNLPTGMYIVSAYNARTQVSYKDKIIVQH